MTHLRSSLAAHVAPERRKRPDTAELERRAWREHRIMLVHADDRETPGLVRMWLEATAKRRFG